MTAKNRFAGELTGGLFEIGLSISTALGQYPGRLVESEQVLIFKQDIG